jgi:hypothetical protein
MRVSGVWLWALCFTIIMAQVHRVAAASAGAGAGPGIGSGLEVLKYQLAANQDSPELCFLLSQTIVRQPDAPLESFVAVEPAAKLSARPRNNTLCVTGFDFGLTYAVSLKSGLPGVSGTLPKDAQFRIQIPDRPPELSFVSPTAEFLPRLGSEGLPIRSVNTPRIAIEIFRISDRDMLPRRPRPALTGDMVAAFAPLWGERVWRGAVEPKGGSNQDTVTFVPIDKYLGTLKPGLYVAVAWPGNVPAASGKQTLPTQYFAVSDLGLSLYRSGSGLLASVRSLSTAAAAQGVDLALIAADNRELGRARTDENGIARFDGGPLQGGDLDRPEAVYAYGPAGEFTALSPPPSPLYAEFTGPSQARVILQTDRANYAPRDVVSLTALTRNAAGMAAPKMPLVINVYRPNGALFFQAMRHRSAARFSMSPNVPRVCRSRSAPTSRCSIRRNPALCPCKRNIPTGSLPGIHRARRMSPLNRPITRFPLSRASVSDWRTKPICRSGPIPSISIPTSAAKPPYRSGSGRCRMRQGRWTPGSKSTRSMRVAEPWMRRLRSRSPLRACCSASSRPKYRALPKARRRISKWSR